MLRGAASGFAPLSTTVVFRLKSLPPDCVFALMCTLGNVRTVGGYRLLSKPILDKRTDSLYPVVDAGDAPYCMVSR
jgi:hypothetical protein